MMWPPIIFYSLSTLIFWTLTGYYMFLKCFCCCRCLQESPVDEEGDFSIVVIAYNAERYLLKKLEELISYKTSRLKEIWIVDDGSDDNSFFIVDKLKDGRLKKLSLPRGGKSKALNLVRSKISTDHAVLMDVRQSMAEVDVLKLVNRLSEENMGAVSGALCLPGGDKTYWNIEKKIRYYEGLWGRTIGLTGSGCAISCDVWQQIPDNCLADDLALGLSVLSQGKKVCLDPEVNIVETLESTYEVELPRKIRTLSANWQIVFSPFQYSLPKNILTLLFIVSHKFLRLLLPFMFVAVFVTGYLMHCDILNDVFCGVLLLSVLSVFPIKSLSPVRQFIYLNIAALVAFFCWPKYSKKGYW